jgi:hypothetical protein
LLSSIRSLSERSYRGGYEAMRQPISQDARQAVRFGPTSELSIA